MSAMPVQAMVLAAGLGKRMRPLTDRQPKPLIQVAGRSLIDRALDRLEEAGVERVVVNTSYKADMLEDHLRKRPCPQIFFSREDEPLETGGGVARALPHFGDTPFFAVNGDIIWLDGANAALKRLGDAWRPEVDVILLLHPVEKAVGYDGPGDFNLKGDGAITRRSGATAPFVYAGVQLLHPRLFKDCPHGAFSLNLLYDEALGSRPARMKAVIHDGAWLHVGDIEGLGKAEAYLRRPKGEGGQSGCG